MDEKFTNLPLNPLRAFSIAYRHKTFTAAARHMGISQVAISRQIKLLEDYLGLQLFERGARSAKLTEHGRAFGQEIAPIFDDLQAAAKRLLSHERQHVINLRVYPTLAHYWLLPKLADFRARFPEFEVRLDTAVQPLDFRGTQLDVAMQLGTGSWRDAKSRILFEERLDVICSPSYAGTLGETTDPGRLTDATILHSKYRRRSWQDWSERAGVACPSGVDLEFDSSLLTYSAAINGMGLAIGQIDILHHDLKAGHLVTPFNTPQHSNSGFHVVWPNTKSVSTQTRRFIDWLLAECAQQPEFFKKTG